MKTLCAFQKDSNLVEEVSHTLNEPASWVDTAQEETNRSNLFASPYDHLRMINPFADNEIVSARKKSPKTVSESDKIRSRVTI